jgi:hypothetical protein
MKDRERESGRMRKRRRRCLLWVAKMEMEWPVERNYHVLWKAKQKVVC